MQLLIIVIVFCALIFLYTLHLLTEDDYVILRKNLSTEKIFNLAFAMGLIGLVSARFFYVLFNPRPVFFEPLGFLLFPYFPGLSLMGALAGSLLFLVLYSRRVSLPLGRVLDFMAKAFLSAAPFGALGIMIITLNFSKLYVLALAFYFGLFGVSIFFQKRLEEWLSDGSFGLISIISVSIFSVIFRLIQEGFSVATLFRNENYLSFAFILVSLVLLARNERKRLSRPNAA